ncbi:MAG: hypothetical protein ACI915_002446, partial [Gammaproteobacteria bacterium]
YARHKFLSTWNVDNGNIAALQPDLAVVTISFQIR